MAEISDYVRAIFYRDSLSILAIPAGWNRRSEIVPIFETALQSILDHHGASDVIDAREFAEVLFGEFEASNSLQKREIDFAGDYYSLSHNRFNAVRQKELDNNVIHQMSEQIGARFYGDVFAGFRGQHPLLRERDAAQLVPASNRIVSLSHNQIVAMEEPIADLVDKLERDNGIPDSPGLKEQLVGEIKAGRELLRAGTYRAYLLHVTLIRALGEIMKRYQGSAIAMVAASLVDLLVKNALGAA